MDILGVRVDNFSKKEVLERVGSFLSDGGFHQISTINPEFILEARKNKEFMDILNGCDLNIPDGVGLQLAFWKKGSTIKSRIAGADLFEDLLGLAEKAGLRVFLVVNKDGLSSWEEVREAILGKYPNLSILGANMSCHPELIEESNGLTRRSLNSARNDILNSDVIFCNFGAPHQEKFLASLKEENCGMIKIVMGVGGSFDFLTGKLKRAPVLLRILGIEWLFRLVQQPKRFKRIFNAVVVFPTRLIFCKK